MGKSVGSVFSNSGDKVIDAGGNQTGWTMKDIKGFGMGPDQMKQSGLSAQPTEGVAFARKATRGALFGLGNGLKEMSQPQQGGGPVPIEVQPSVIDPRLMQQSDYLMDARRRYANPLFGG